MREENSSSQNVNLFITAITKRGSSVSGFTVGFSDGSSFFVSFSFIEENPLTINQIVNDELLEKLELESNSIKALIKGIDLINRSEQSSGGLFIKLKKRGFSDIVSKGVVSRLVSDNLLQDDRFAEMWLHSRLRKHPEGVSRLFAGLVSRGVPSSVAKESIEKYTNEEILEQAVIDAGQKLLKRDKMSGQKLKDSLYRLGFSYREIKYFLDNTGV